jgi:hypothetical protein
MCLARNEIGDRSAIVAKGKSLEEGAPGRVNPIGIVEPLPVHRFNDINVGARG